MKRIAALTLIAVFCFVMLASAPPARAATYSYVIGDFNGSCDNTGINAQGTVTANLPTEVDIIATYYVNDVVLYTMPSWNPPMQGTYPGWLWIVFPTPLASSTYSFSLTGEFVVDGVSVGTAVFRGQCTNGTFFGTGSYLDGKFAGPTVPSGFVLRTVTCDVAVFDTPGGSPVGANRITAGQTFFVSPESTNAPDGEAWTQVFVSSFASPWIPTRCVGQ